MGYLNDFQKQWVLVDYQSISGATTAVTFGAAGTSLRQYPVNGDLDLGYAIIAGTNGSGSARVRLNGVNTNQSDIINHQNNAGGVANGPDTEFAAFTGVGVAGAVGSGNNTVFLIDNAQTGATRIGLCWCSQADGANRQDSYTVGRWNDTATNITSILLDWYAGNVTSGKIWLYVKNPQTPLIWSS